jgi:hypothetical protein
MFPKLAYKSKPKPKVIKIQMQERKECFVCHCTYGLEGHHAFGGANRPLSELYGLKVWLCPKDHTGDDGNHFNKELRQQIQDAAQKKFEEIYGHDEFLRIFRGVVRYGMDSGLSTIERS